MTRTTTICWWCGQPLNFRTVEGIVRPIHPKKTRCPGRAVVRQLSLPFTQLFVPAFEQPVTVGKCKCPAKSTILRVKHDHGHLLFEQLEFPWKRHVCDEKVDIDYFGLDYLRRQSAQEQDYQMSLALVAGSRRMWGRRPSIYVAVLELARPTVRHRLEVRCDETTPSELIQRAQINPGSLVGLCTNGSVRRLISLSGSGFECVDSNCPPGKLDIPAQWFDVAIQPRA